MKSLKHQPMDCSIPLEECGLARVASSDLEIKHDLGSGAYCVVRACTFSRKELALKTTKMASHRHLEAVADLQHELEVMAAMRHASILLVQGFGESPNGQPFVLFDRLRTTVKADLPPDRDTASNWARRAGVERWPLERAIRLSIELAEALDYCHWFAFEGARLIHRDIKPANLGLDGADRLKLFDFGLSSLWKIGDADAGGTERRLLTPNTGSLRYMAPEVARGEAYNHKCDMYSWALLLWEMSAHVPPYQHQFEAFLEASGEAAFIERVSYGDLRPEPRSEWPSKLATLLTDAWASDPDARPDTRHVIERASEVLSDLKARQTGLGLTRKNGLSLSPKRERRDSEEAAEAGLAAVCSPQSGHQPDYGFTQLYGRCESPMSSEVSCSPPASLRSTPIASPPSTPVSTRGATPTPTVLAAGTPTPLPTPLPMPMPEATNAPDCKELEDSKESDAATPHRWHPHRCTAGAPAAMPPMIAPTAVRPRPCLVYMPTGAASPLARTAVSLDLLEAMAQEELDHVI